MHNQQGSTTTDVLPPLPVPEVSISARAGWPHLHLAVSTTDRWGRLADRSTVSYLSWKATQAVAFELRNGLIVVSSDTTSTHAIDNQGYLRLPAQTRHCASLDVQERLLLAATRKPQILVIYPPLIARQLLCTADTSIWGQP